MKPKKSVALPGIVAGTAEFEEIAHLPRCTASCPTNPSFKACKEKLRGLPAALQDALENIMDNPERKNPVER